MTDANTLAVGGEGAPRDAARTVSGRGLGAWCLGLALAGSTALTLWSLAPTWRGVIGLPLIAAWFAIPGVVGVRRVYASRPGARWAALLMGAPVGYALSSLVLLACWAAGWRSGWLLLLAPAIAIALAWPARFLGSGLSLPRLGRRDVAPLLVVLLVVPLVVSRPYSRIGARVPEGRAYRAYFTADFVWAMAVVAEVSKGDGLPHNPYLKGRPLHYYWLPHLMPALEYRATHRRLTLEQVLAVDAYFAGLAFAGFLYFFVRHFVRRRAAAVFGCVTAMLFSSFEGLQHLWSLWHHGLPFGLVRYVNIDAVARWFFDTMPIDGLQRLLLYQPQHELGYALALSALLVLWQARDVTRVGSVLLAALLLAAALLFSTFSALMIGAVAVVYQLARLLAARAWRAMAVGSLLAALPLVGAAAIVRVLHYVQTGSHVVAVGPNDLAVRHWATGLLLSLGPVLLLAGAGVMTAPRRRVLRRVALPLLVIAVSFAFYFLVDVPEHQDVYVGWRAGHLILIASAPLLGLALQNLVLTPRRRRGLRAAAAAAAIGLVLAAALPTTAIDLYNSQDIDNRGFGAGFPWTLVLTHDEAQALLWIKRMTPPNALVQVEPTVRDPATWAYIPAFAERRMYAGIPISMVPLEDYHRASARVRRLYRSPDTDALHERVRLVAVDYLVVGPPERQAYPQIEDLLSRAPDLFSPMFRNTTMAIYAVNAGPLSTGRTKPGA